MARALTLAAAAYKLVWVRVALYILIPFCAAFMAASADITDEKWDAMRTFTRWKFWVAVSIPALNSFVAFLDQSLSRANDKAEKLKTQHRIESMKPEDAP